MPTSNNVKTVAFSAPSALAERLDAAVKTLRRDHEFVGVTRSAVVRLALVEFLDRLDAERPATVRARKRGKAR